MADNKHNRGAAVERQPGPQNLLRTMEEELGSGQVVSRKHRVAQVGAEVKGTPACNACRCMAKWPLTREKLDYIYKINKNLDTHRHAMHR